MIDKLNYKHYFFDDLEEDLSNTFVRDFNNEQLKKSIADYGNEYPNFVYLGLGTKSIRTDHDDPERSRRDNYDAKNPEKFNGFFRFMKLKILDRDGNQITSKEEQTKHTILTITKEGEKKKEGQEKTVKGANKKKNQA